jgi:hypothetical protein
MMIGSCLTVRAASRSTRKLLSALGRLVSGGKSGVAAFTSFLTVLRGSEPSTNVRVLRFHLSTLTSQTPACLKMLGLSAAMSAVVLVVVSVPIAFLALLVWVRSRLMIGSD